MTLAQVPGIDQALQAAGQHGYEAVLIVIVFACMIGGIGWMMRQREATSLAREKMSLERELRMATRIDRLESDIREIVQSQRDEAREMVEECRKALDQNSNVIQKLIETLEERACLWSLERQKEVVQQATDIAAGVLATAATKAQFLKEHPV